MKLIRWPVVSLILFLLLTGFFTVEYASHTTVRENFEQYATQILNTMVGVGNLKVDIFGSTVRLEDVTVLDPANKGAYALSARSVDVHADAREFFNKRVVLQEVCLFSPQIRLFQTSRGGLAALSQQGFGAGTDSVEMRARKLLTWTADRVNPMKIIANLQQAAQTQLQRGNQATTRMMNESVTTTEKAHEMEPARSSEYRLKIPQEEPSFVIRKLLATDAMIDLVAFRDNRALRLHNVQCFCTDISSQPKKSQVPVTFLFHGNAGDGTGAWFTAYVEVNAHAGDTNIFVDFAISNLNLHALLPFAHVYAKWLDGLAVESGTLTARGTIQIKQGVVQPTSIYCHADKFTARTTGLATGNEWLEQLSMSNSFMEVSVPIDNTRPYFHIEKAIAHGMMRTKIENFRLRFRPGKSGDKTLDSLIH